MKSLESKQDETRRENADIEISRQEQINKNIFTSRRAEILTSRNSCQNIRDFQLSRLVYSSRPSKLIWYTKIETMKRINDQSKTNNKKQRLNYPLSKQFLYFSLSLSLSLSLSYYIRINTYAPITCVGSCWHDYSNYSAKLNVS